MMKNDLKKTLILKLSITLSIKSVNNLLKVS